MTYQGPLDCLFRLADPALGWPNHQSTYLLVPDRVSLMTDENTDWGKDSGTGLYNERKTLEQQPCGVFKQACTGIYIQPNLTDVSNDVFEVSPGSPEKSVWAFQERILPARILCYRSFELQWDCLENPGSESLPTEPKRRFQRPKAEEIGTYLQYGPQQNCFSRNRSYQSALGQIRPEFYRFFLSSLKRHPRKVQPSPAHIPERHLCRFCPDHENDREVDRSLASQAWDPHGKLGPDSPKLLPSRKKKPFKNRKPLVAQLAVRVDDALSEDIDR